MREAHAKSMFQIGSEEVNFVCAKRTQNQCFKQVLGEVHFVCAKRTQNEPSGFYFKPSAGVVNAAILPLRWPHRLPCQNARVQRRLPRG